MFNSFNNKETLAFLSILLLFYLPVSSQDLEAEFNEFQDSITDNFQNSLTEQKREYSEHIQNINNEFSTFLEDADQEFTSFLKEEWMSFKTTIEEKNKNDEKPLTPKKYTSTKHTLKVFKNYSNLQYRYIKQNDVITPAMFHLPKDVSDLSKLLFMFYGSELSVNYDPNIIKKNITTINNESIALFWKDISKCHYASSLIDLKKIKEELNLNDWAYFQMVSSFCQNIEGLNKNSKVLFNWFILLKSGYNVKVGVYNNKVYLLFSSENKLYNKAYLILENIKYYVFEGYPVKLETFSEKYRKGVKINLSFDRPLLLRKKTLSKTIEFKIDRKAYSFKLNINKNLIDFYSSYPQTDLYIYSQSLLSDVARESLIQAISPHVNNLSNEESFRFILKFVQSSFDYKVDKDNFGREKYLFPEETLFYNFSDCEDRALLFAWLLKEFFNIETIGIDYNGHLVLGVPWDKEPETGNFINLDSVNYILADPTYFNAPLGIIAPDLTDIEPTLFPLFIKPGTVKSDNVDMKGIITEDILHVNESESYFCGYFTDTIKLSGEKLKPLSNNSQIIIGKVKNGEINKLLIPKSTNECFVHKLTRDNSGNLYVLGSFEGQLIIERDTLNSNEENFFVLKINTNNKVEWLSQFDAACNSSKFSYYSAVIGNQGDLLNLSYINTGTPSNLHTIKLDESGNIILSGSIRTTHLLVSDSLVFESGDEFEILDWLIQENNRLIKSNYSPKISPLISVLNLLIRSNETIHGDIIAKSFLRELPKNPLSGKINTVLLNKLEKVRKLHNFLLINTIESQTIEIEDILFYDNSRIKVSVDEHLTRLFVYSGVRLKQNQMSYKINYFTVNNFTGEIKYDYDNHYRTTIPTRHIYIEE